MARRSEALGRGRGARRHRHARLQSRRLRDRARARRTRGRSHFVRRWARARRQRPDHAALRERRARGALGEPDRAGQRERAQAARLWDEGRRPLGAGQSELYVLVAVREVDAHRHPRRAGFGRCGGARDARPARPSGRLSRRLRQHLFGGRARHQGGARRGRSRRRASISRPSRTASKASPSSRRQ